MACEPHAAAQQAFLSVPRSFISRHPPTSHFADVNDAVIGARRPSSHHAPRPVDNEHHDVENRADEHHRDEQRRPDVLLEWVNQREGLAEPTRSVRQECAGIGQSEEGKLDVLHPLVGHNDVAEQKIRFLQNDENSLAFSTLRVYYASHEHFQAQFARQCCVVRCDRRLHVDVSELEIHFPCENPQQRIVSAGDVERWSAVGVVDGEQRVVVADENPRWTLKFIEPNLI